jgi:hypothetical protein
MFSFVPTHTSDLWSTHKRSIKIANEFQIVLLFTTLLQPTWVYDSEADKLVFREISYVPGLYKIFDEILVNAADNKQRDPKMNTIKVDIDK